MTKYTLPPQATPLIGRAQELADVLARLREPACTLLTIVGAGGVGKTRLALAAASRARDDFAAGVTFVDLQPVEASDFFSAIADALPVTLSGREPPQVQLRDYLRDKEVLLLLDNVEHLLDIAISVGELVTQASSAKLLVTSREALSLQGECLYPLRGLSVPSASDEDDIADYGAVQFFQERAHLSRPDFSLNKEQQGVIRICRMVEGNPLALELAASWARVLSCAEIADEIQHSIDFLSTSLRNVPERHRSMQAVFARSLGLLTDEERRVFERLSVFRGGFHREAARAVAGASLAVLSVLVDKSLLRREEDGRYTIHELLRQYARKKLAHGSQDDVTSVRDRHCTYVLAFLADRNADMSGERQLAAAAEIAADFDNVRAAWQWAVAQEKVDDLANAAFALYHFCQFGSRYLEGAQMFAQAARIVDNDTLFAQPKTMLILTCLGWFQVRLGRLEQADAVFARAHAVYRRLDDLPEMPYAFAPSLGLGLLAGMRGAYGEAKRFLRPRHGSERHDHPLNETLAHYILAGIYLAQGRYEAAQHHAQLAYAAVHSLGDRWFMAYCHNAMGHVAAARGNYEAATKHYQASYAIRDDFNDIEGMALALNHLGETALWEKDVIRAKRLFQESCDVYEGIDDKGGLAKALHGLGRTALAPGDTETARQTLSRALHIAAEIQFEALVLDIIVSVSELILKDEPTARAIIAWDWLAFVQAHSTAGHLVIARAKELREQFTGKAAPPEVKFKSVAALVADVQAKLAMAAPDQKLEQVEEKIASSLAEPLTEREHEVLRLLAQGLTNKEIAEELTVVVGTIKTHNHNIYGKLGVDNRVEAVTRARELGLV